jgi:hypothetical protein
VNSPLSIVIRMPNVTLSRFNLEKALGLPMDRYQRPSDGLWGLLRSTLRKTRTYEVPLSIAFDQIVDAVQRLVSENLIGPPCLDAAMKFPSSALQAQSQSRLDWPPLRAEQGWIISPLIEPAITLFERQPSRLCSKRSEKSWTVAYLQIRARGRMLRHSATAKQ